MSHMRRALNGAWRVAGLAVVNIGDGAACVGARDEQKQLKARCACKAYEFWIQAWSFFQSHCSPPPPVGLSAGGPGRRSCCEVVSVRACVCARVHVCVCVRVRVHVRARRRLFG